jgi:hypothetical protein
MPCISYPLHKNEKEILVTETAAFFTMTSTFDYYRFFSQLPDDMKKYHILPELDYISTSCLMNVLLGKPLPYLDTTVQTLQLISHGFDLVEYYLKAQKVNINTLVNSAISKDDAKVFKRCRQETDWLYHPYDSCNVVRTKAYKVMRYMLDEDMALSANVFRIAAENCDLDMLEMLRSSPWYNRQSLGGHFVYPPIETTNPKYDFPAQLAWKVCIEKQDVMLEEHLRALDWEYRQNIYPTIHLNSMYGMVGVNQEDAIRVYPRTSITTRAMSRHELIDTINTINTGFTQIEGIVYSDADSPEQELIVPTEKENNNKRK